MGWKTPFECVYGYKPPLSHLDILGSKVYALKKNIPRLDKLLARAHIGYLVGWESTNIYKVWVPSLGRIINTRDVNIDSGNIYDPKDLDIAEINKMADYDIIKSLEWPSLVEDSPLQNEEDSVETFMNTSSARKSNEIFIAEKEVEDSCEVEKLERSESNGVTYKLSDETPLSKVNLYTDKILKYEISSQAMDGDRQLPKQKGNTAINAALVNSEINPQNIISRRTRDRNPKKSSHLANQFHSPKGWNQMLRHKCTAEFNRVAEREYESLYQKGTWTHVPEKDLPDEVDLIPLIWIFSHKFDSDGLLLKFKAKICVRGDLQSSEEETYAATLACQIFRAMMAITVTHDLELRQYDVLNAFVNSPIRGEVFCLTLKGFEKEIDGSKAVLRFQKGLYGLKVSPLYWYDEFVSFLLDQEFYQVPGVNCMFTNQYLNLIFHVDNIKI
ncbi:Retrovirus-related Pol polyprotein from transposon RE2 [Golovinomyces cichoracearum]|uniref:Retrovirus-related Pol polyprotein from transposon RE2 n=1 Tax=Golovinomyces cichoracearum TaxID=62708 RepID=A0A420ICT1_9PEZI|nr:Retrovirus-related Pol polyprotein from transposon RE2 [Golovinomyces cichoracearum]